MSVRLPALLITFVLWFMLNASAQQQPSGDILAGYSYANADLGSDANVGMHGYDASAEHNLLPWLGIVVDNDAHFGSAPVYSNIRRCCSYAND